MIRFGVKTSPARDYGNYDTLRKVWLEAERLGFHSGWLFDHLFELPQIGPSKEPCLEFWTTLSALAAETKSLRFGAAVACVSYRNPAILAKMASTLDVISHGRLEFGIGAGWASVEHEAYGIPFDRPAARIARLREAIIIIKKMWTEEEPSFEGKYYRIRGAINNPKPLQKPHPPIWVGGGGEKLTLRVTAELADGCNFIGLTPEDYRHKIEVLDAHCDRFGRKVSEVQRSWQGSILIAESQSELEERERRLGARADIAGTPEQCVEKMAKYVDLGVSCFMLSFLDATSNLKCLGLFSDRVMPSFITH